MSNDLYFRFEDGAFNVRSAGVFVQNGCILLQREAGGAEYALPGGQVKLGETGQSALEREFLEEIGAKIKAGPLLWVEECFFTLSGMRRHSICLYYEVQAECGLSLSEGKFVPQKDHPHVEYGLVPIKNVSGLTVYPDFLSEALSDSSGEIRHYVSRC